MKRALLPALLLVLTGCAGADRQPQGALSAAEWQVLSAAQSGQLGQLTAAEAVHAAGVLGDTGQAGLMVVCSEAEPSMIVLMVDGASRRQRGEVANVILTADQGDNLGMEFTFGNQLMFIEGIDAVRLVTLIQRADTTLDVSVDGEADIRFAADHTDRITAVTGRCRAAWPGGSGNLGS